jgi:hypothetical protein
MNIKTASYWLILLAFLYASLELCCAMGLRILQVTRHVDYSPFPPALIETQHKKQLQKLIAGQTKYQTYSRELGWTLKPNGRTPLESANSQGLRADHDYSPQPVPGKIRIAAFGDSFTHGSNVVNADTWEEFMVRHDPRLEVLNFGVGGYGLDQALLRYQKEGLAYRPDIVLIGYISEDISRHINTFRPFTQPLTGMPLAKPRFLLEGEKLVLAPNPMQDVKQYQALLENPQDTLKQLGKHDVRYQHAYRPGPFDFLPSVRLAKEFIQFCRYPEDALFTGGEYNLDSEAYRVTEKIFDEFVKAALKEGSLPILIIFPNQSDLRDYRRKGGVEYAPLLRHFEEQGYLFIDAVHAFDGDASKLELEEIFDGHYRPLGNKLVGMHIHHFLTKQDLFSKAAVQKLVARLQDQSTANQMTR